MSDPEDLVHDPARGIAATHPERETQPFVVAPTTENDFNVLSVDLVAVACLKLQDVLFEFDSSFPNTKVATMLAQLPALREAHRNAKGEAPPLSIFGHADPVGNDDYNKQLSGRRAIAIFAVLTRDLALWDFLFDTPAGGDNWKANKFQEVMRQAVGAPTGKSRKELSQAYMDLLCPFQLQKADFLGKGADAKGKADFQGCSEFNPLVLLSESENKTLSHTKRNEENAINRRVLIFLFKAGTKVNPKQWPCPTALAGTADCFKRFFGPPKTGNDRRKAGPARRTFEETGDTFGCRFYDRVQKLSPCEGPLPLLLDVTPLIFFEDAEPVVAAPAASGATISKASASSLAPSVGAPQINAGKSVVVVKKPHTSPKRVPVVLKTDTPFAGTGQFTVSPADTILFFQTPTGGTAIKTPKVFTGPALTRGVTLFAEAKKVSGSVDDVTLTLNLTGGGKTIKNNPKTEKMTAVELFLDIHKIRTAAGSDPPALSETDKINPGRAIHVQNAAKKRRRALLTVKQVKPGFPAKFTNKLELTVNNAKVTLFNNETPPASGGDPTSATPLEIDPAKLPLKFFVEGTTVSDKVRDTTFKLGIKGFEPDGDRVVTTVIETKLDIFKSREKAGTARVPLSDNDKIKIGRFIHRQDPGATKGKHRALMILRPIKPAGFVGKLVLTPVESLLPTPGPAKALVFAKEVPDAAAALGMPLEIDHGAKFPAEGERRFVEGSVVSGGLIDSGFRLGVKDVEDECDRIALTIFQVEKVEVRLARTRCRRAAAAPPEPAPKTITTSTKTFDATTPTVVRGCGDLKMEATVKPPVVPLSWSVERAADDDKGLKGLPTDAADGAANKRKVTGDATGSFHVSAFVDANGNGKHSDDEDGVVVNVNIVEIKVPAGAANNRIIRNSLYTGSTAGVLLVRTGTTGGFAPGVGAAYGDEQFPRHLIGFRVKVNLLGGGGNKRRGVDKVTLGYDQTTISDSVAASYADGRQEQETLFVLPIPAANIGPGGQVVSNPALAKLPFPVRDTRGNSNSGTGPFIISSSDTNPPDKKNIAGGGEERVVRMLDSPAIVLDLRHPVTNSPLVSIAGSNDFEDFLVAFSSDFNENYTAIATARWSTTYGTFTPAGGLTTAAAAPTAPASMTVFSPSREGDKTDMERCPPNFVDTPAANGSLRLDAR